jgi:hypothetical protein
MGAATKGDRVMGAGRRNSRRSAEETRSEPACRPAPALEWLRVNMVEMRLVWEAAPPPLKPICWAVTSIGLSLGGHHAVGASTGMLSELVHAASRGR